MQTTGTSATLVTRDCACPYVLSDSLELSSSAIIAVQQIPFLGAVRMSVKSKFFLQIWCRFTTLSRTNAESAHILI